MIESSLNFDTSNFFSNKQAHESLEKSLSKLKSAATIFSEQNTLILNGVAKSLAGTVVMNDNFSNTIQSLSSSLSKSLTEQVILSQDFSKIMQEISRKITIDSLSIPSFLNKDYLSEVQSISSKLVSQVSSLSEMIDYQYSIQPVREILEGISMKLNPSIIDYEGFAISIPSDTYQDTFDEDSIKIEKQFKMELFIYLIKSIDSFKNVLSSDTFQKLKKHLFKIVLTVNFFYPDLIPKDFESFMIMLFGETQEIEMKKEDTESQLNESDCE